MRAEFSALTLTWWLLMAYGDPILLDALTLAFTIDGLTRYWCLFYCTILLWPPVPLSSSRSQLKISFQLSLCFFGADFTWIFVATAWGSHLPSTLRFRLPKFVAFPAAPRISEYTKKKIKSTFGRRPQWWKFRSAKFIEKFPVWVRWLCVLGPPNVDILWYCTLCCTVRIVHTHIAIL